MRSGYTGLADCASDLAASGGDYSLSCLASEFGAYFATPGNLDAYMPSGTTLLYIGLGILGLILVTR